MAIDPHEVANNDERWVRVRAEPQTVFMRDARALLSRSGEIHTDVCDGRTSLALSRSPGPDQRKPHRAAAGLEDVGERRVDGCGLPRRLLPAGGNAELAYQAMARGDGEEGSGLDVRLGAEQRDGKCESSFARADKVGAEHILYWEADYIDDRPAAAEIKAGLRQRASI
jgi:hypothetical protein